MPIPATSKFPIFLQLGIEGSSLVWINGGNTNAIGQPSREPIKDTTLSRLSIVNTATIAKMQTMKEDITFRCCKHVHVPHVFCTVVDMDLHAISSEGKFCNGKVNMTYLGMNDVQQIETVGQ